MPLRQFNFASASRTLEMLHRVVRGSFLAVLLAAGVPLLAQPADAPELRTARSARMVTAYSKVDGKGTPILLLHGWASDSTVWDLLVPRLRGLGPLLAVDAPGSGRSPPSSSAFTYRLYAGGAAEVLAREQVAKSAIVIAHSFGAYAAREFVRAYPSQTCAIVLLDGAFNPAFADEAAARNFIAELTKEAWPLALAARDKPAGASPETLQRLPAMHRRSSRDSAIAWIEAQTDSRLYAPDRVSLPVLMVLRSGSTWATEEYVAKIRSFVPQLQVRRLGNVSHFLAWDAPEETAALIRDFAKAADCKPGDRH